MPSQATIGNLRQPSPRNGLCCHIYGKMGGVKTTVEIPDALFRKAKATAAERGVSLKALLTDAVREHLGRDARNSLHNKPSAPAWMSAFGALRGLHKETKRINQVLEREFELIEEDEWR
jgi:hypothetical protein